MNDQPNAEQWMLPDDLAAPERNPAFESTMAGWPMVAAVAWGGYHAHGRGAVMVDEEGRLTYHAGPPCECHRIDVEIYDPERQAVVALHDGDAICQILVLAGWPAPPDAHRITPASGCG